MNELYIVRSIQKKELTALTKLMDILAESVYAIAYSIVGTLANDEEIAEIVKETFLYVWNEPLTFNKEEDTLKTWVYKIARQKSLEMKRKLLNEKPIEDVINYYVVDDINDQNETMIDMEKFKNSLSKDERNILIRRFFLEENIEHIAKETNISLEEVDAMIWRIRRVSKGLFK